MSSPLYSIKSISEVIEFFKKKYSIDIPTIQLSIPTIMSSGMILQYLEDFRMGKENYPFFIGLPAHLDVVPWIATLLLFHLFRDDIERFSTDRIEELRISGGELVEIFGSVGKYHGVSSNGFYQIEFRDGARIMLKPEFASYINRTKRKSLNRTNHYQKNRREFRRNLTPLSECLGLEINPNPASIRSEVIIVAGRGTRARIEMQLKKTEVNGELFDKVIGLNANLRIIADLERIRQQLEEENTSGNFDFFKAAVKQVLSNYHFESEELEEQKKKFISSLTRTNSEIHRLFTKLRDSLEDEDNEIKEILGNLASSLPPLKEFGFENVKAIIVCDPRQLLIFGNTIQKLIDMGFPVIALLPNYFPRYEDRDLLSRIFTRNNYEGSPRFIWTPEKIETCISNEGKIHPADYDFTKKLDRILRQKIAIVEQNRPSLNSAFKLIEDREVIADLHQSDLPRKEYFSILRPLIYAYKNDPWAKLNDCYIDQLNEFKKRFEEWFYLLPSKFADNIGNALQALSIIEDWNVEINEDSPIFQQQINIGENSYSVPSGEGIFVTASEISLALDSLWFSGFPYKEYNFGHLLSAAFESIIPELKVLVVSIESNRVHRYLVQRIHSACFTDNIPSSWIMPEGFYSNDLDSIIHDSTKHIQIDQRNAEEMRSNDLDEEYSIERLEQELNEILYSSYTAPKVSHDSISNEYSLLCNVIHFSNGSWLFLPTESEILSIREENGKLRCKNRKFRELENGMLIANYWISRKSMIEMIEKSGSLVSTIEELYEWRDILFDALENEEKDVGNLSERLREKAIEAGIPANPNYLNLSRWLHDDFLLAPLSSNLQTILLLKYDQGQISAAEDRIMKARHIISRGRNGIRRMIRTEIVRKLEKSSSLMEEHFEIIIHGVRVDVRLATIIGLEKGNDLRIEYRSTTKILDN